MVIQLKTFVPWWSGMTFLVILGCPSKLYLTQYKIASNDTSREKALTVLSGMSCIFPGRRCKQICFWNHVSVNRILSKTRQEECYLTLWLQQTLWHWLQGFVTTWIITEIVKNKNLQGCMAYAAILSYYFWHFVWNGKKEL